MHSEGFRWALDTDPVALDQAWSDWKASFGRAYSSKTEESRARGVFTDNLRRVASFNLGPENGGESWLEPNRFADLTFQEFSARYLMTPRVGPTAVPDAVPVAAVPGATVPDTVPAANTSDDSGFTRRRPSRRLMALPTTAVDMSAYATSVKNQGGCGSCWAFAATAAIESAVLKAKAIKNLPNAIDLAEEQVTACVRAPSYPGSDGCNGGWPTDVFSYTLTNGIVGESSRPYTAGNTGITPNCSVPVASSVKITRTGSSAVKSGSAIVNSMSTNGPVVLYVFVNANFQLYSGGVLPSTACTALEMGPYVNHAVLATGYVPGTRKTPGYFRIKNSWGTGWGELGYIRIAATNDGTSGTCNLYANGAFHAAASSTSAQPT